MQYNSAPVGTRRVHREHKSVVDFESGLRRGCLVAIRSSEPRYATLTFKWMTRCTFESDRNLTPVGSRVRRSFHPIIASKWGALTAEPREPRATSFLRSVTSASQIPAATYARKWPSAVQPGAIVRCPVVYDCSWPNLEIRGRLEHRDPWLKAELP